MVSLRTPTEIMWAVFRRRRRHRCVDFTVINIVVDVVFVVVVVLLLDLLLFFAMQDYICFCH